MKQRLGEVAEVAIKAVREGSVTDKQAMAFLIAKFDELLRKEDTK
ncbi:MULTISPECIES: hypothetical protein [unclassified Cytobacillus]|nr:hypothetical protein [Cytobacillus sp. AMY 15.2]